MTGWSSLPGEQVSPLSPIRVRRKKGETSQNQYSRLLIIAMTRCSECSPITKEERKNYTVCLFVSCNRSSWRSKSYTSLLAPSLSSLSYHMHSIMHASLALEFTAADPQKSFFACDVTHNVKMYGLILNAKSIIMIILQALFLSNRISKKSSR